ncbi:hypothetical protein CHU98_g8027 [Xylaria longipes]|nr:hypothetical protein CHU98_g8027 [Xylaria longipes]
MYNAKILLSVAALTGTSLAQTATPTASTNAACAASLTSFTNAPSPNAALAKYMDEIFKNGPVTAPGETTALPDFTLEDPTGYQNVLCSIAGEIPASILPDFASYGSALLSYGSVHLSSYDAYVTNCITTGEAASTIISELHEMLEGTGGLRCPAVAMATPTGSPNGTYPTGTGSSYPTSTGSATLIPTAAAARPTGALVGAAAIGGLLGAVALL